MATPRDTLDQPEDRELSGVQRTICAAARLLPPTAVGRSGSCGDLASFRITTSNSRPPTRKQAVPPSRTRLFELPPASSASAVSGDSGGGRAVAAATGMAAEYGRGDACVAPLLNGVAGLNGAVLAKRQVGAAIAAAGVPGTMNVLPQDLQRVVCPATACGRD